MIIPVEHNIDPEKEERDSKYRVLAKSLTPENPIRSQQYLRGRESVLEDLVRELTHFKSTPFVFGQRGVGKTSLACTAAQICSLTDTGYVYSACSPGCRLNTVLRNICLDLIQIAIQYGVSGKGSYKFDVNLSLNPSIKLSIEKKYPIVDELNSISDAFMMIRDLDKIIPTSNQIVVVLDELEELNESDRGDLAFLLKQIGDQDIGFRFMLVGIAQNVHELIGAHQSVPRYLKEVSLEPLDAQILLDIVHTAAEAVGISISDDYLYRISIIGNGFPHFAHLIGKHILTESVSSGSDVISNEIYTAGIKAAVSGSIEELKIAYEQATQRPDEYNKHILWALAHDDLIDITMDNWRLNYSDLCIKHDWEPATISQVTNVFSNFKKATYGKIVVNTPTRYGKSTSRRSFRRFREPLMRGHVRLQAELENVSLGQGYTGKMM